MPTGLERGRPRAVGVVPRGVARTHRASRALEDTGVYGVKTTIPYYLEILTVPEFRAGTFDTSFVEKHPELTDYKTSRPNRELTAVITAALSAHMGM